jgi:hypothetical protein
VVVGGLGWHVAVAALCLLKLRFALACLLALAGIFFLSLLPPVRPDAGCMSSHDGRVEALKHVKTPYAKRVCSDLSQGAAISGVASSGIQVWDITGSII